MAFNTVTTGAGLVPVSTVYGVITSYYTNTIGHTVSTAIYTAQATTIYSLSTSVIEAPTTAYYTTIITTETINSVLEPTATIRTTDSGQTVSSILYGLIDAQTTLTTTYVTTIGLSGTSGLTSNTTSLLPTNSSTSSTSAPTHLSTGAKAGIGIGVTLAVLIFAALAAGWFILQKRRKRNAQVPEVASTNQGGYDKPELDATEVPKPYGGHTSNKQSEKPGLATSDSPPYYKTQGNEVELDATGRPTSHGRVELDGRMVPRADVIRRKEVASATAQSVVDEKEVVHEK